MAVDFPAPFGPRKPCTSPVFTERSRLSRARTLPNVLTTALTSMAVLMLMPFFESDCAGDRCDRTGRGGRAVVVAALTLVLDKRVQIVGGGEHSVGEQLEGRAR